ncbi:gasdermin-D-like [Sceloporus undulatus]|uniref:gasdermin-D-like n=1 Tax=Sceloporus undulatus TaxID=8520 RepID=UPI001C4DCD19|nr:gasdermin-D-like [Sceloporus undulatus]
MFKRLSKQLIQELDSDGKLIPVTSLAHSDSFRPLSLVTKEHSRFPWHTRKYSPTAFKLRDILQDGATMEIELKHSEPLLFSANTCHKSSARVNLKIHYAQVEISGLGSTCSTASPVYVKKTYVDIRELWTTETSLGFIQQVYPKLQFYIVTEAFEITDSLLVEETMQVGGKGEVIVAELLQIQGLNTRVKKRSVLIPRGTVMAYGVEKLQTREEDLVISCPRFQTKLASLLAYNEFQDELGSSLTGVQQVKNAVKEAYEPLIYLSQVTKKNLLESFGILFQDGDIPSTVQSVLELSMVGDNVDRSMLESLNEEFRPSVEMLLSNLGVFPETEKGESQRDLWGPVLFFCSSIDDLDYEMLPLLETIMEKNMMAKQLEMMDSILEWILSGDEGSVFTLPFHSQMDEEADLTAEALQTCGLDLEAGETSITCLWNNKALSELAAFYSSLYVLLILSG